MQDKSIIKILKIKSGIALLLICFLVGCFADVDKIKSCIPKGTLKPTLEIDLYVVTPRDGYSYSHIDHKDEENNYLCFYDLVEKHFQNLCLEDHAKESEKLDFNSSIKLDGYAIKRYGIAADFGYDHSTEFRGKYNDKVVWVSSPTLQRLYQSDTDFANKHRKFFDQLKMRDRVLGDEHRNKYGNDWNAREKIRDNIWNWDCDF